MDIEKFLIENLIDSFYQYSEVVENKSSDEIDRLFIQEDGFELTDKEFIIEYFNDFFNNEMIDSLYGTIVDFSDIGEIDIKKVVAFLASKFYVYNYNSLPSVISYLKITSLDNIANLFKDNYNFGMEMLRTYFRSLVDSETYDKNRNIIFERKDQKRLLEFEKENMYVKIRTINNILRDVICNIYNHYIKNGYEDIEALNNTWMFFFDNLDPLGELDEMGIDGQTKAIYKNYLLGLIYGDLYEDVCNDSIIQSDNYNDKLADIIPILSLRFGGIAIPIQEDLRNRLLKHFILLQDEKEKMKKNRKETYEGGRISELKKVNPFYMLDELTL